ncbi:caspase family protein [Umezawaea endophytica]|uniref:Caspase family protein n=1 Tax=Umezawaea endophytica TaxID=1654476 RepID=A0A9X2VVW0_9PSEU|nr:caspase family protein [Umezawaea endophytica]MCS7483813.1 caspase family protein [Umezawaea endophytica]
MIGDLRAVADRFTRGGFRTEVLVDRTASQLRAALRDHLLRGDFEPDEPVVVWFSGHGVDHPAQGLRLVGVDHDPDDVFAENTIPVGDVLTAFHQHDTLRHLLLVLDCCFAGAGVESLEAARARLEHDLPVSGPDLKQLAVLAAVRPGQRVQDGAFTAALLPAWQELEVDHLHVLDPFVPLKALAAATDDRLRAAHPLVSVHVSDKSTGAEWFPNLRPVRLEADLSASVLDHAVRSARRSALTLGEVAEATEQALAEHFRPKSTGWGAAPAGDDVFVGRDVAIAAVTQWLTGPVDGLAVLTGSAGAGKSAVLGRALADRSGYTIVWARRRTVEDVVRIIAHSCGLPDSTDQAALHAGLARLDGPVRIVVDALDEAGPTQADRGEALRIVALLNDLAVQPDVRVVVGTRDSLLPDLHGARLVVNLDELPYSVSSTDTERYVGALLALNPVYAAEPEATAEVSAAITARVRTDQKTNFLFARTAATARRDDTEPLPRLPDWADRLPESVGAAFTTDIAERLAPDDAAVLTALAWSEGAGISLEDWRLLAAAVTGRDVTDVQVWRVRAAAADYLTLSTSTGKQTVHLFHQALIDHLRTTGDPETTHRRVADTLAGRPWGAIGHYARTHLAAHAAAAGTLDELVQDAGFLLVAAVDSLHRSAHALRSADGHAAYEALQLTLHHWPEADQQRLWWLHVNARRRRADPLAESARLLLREPAWTIVKAWWTGTAHRTIELGDTDRVGRGHGPGAGQDEDRHGGHGRHGPPVGSSGGHRDHCPFRT